MSTRKPTQEEIFAEALERATPEARAAYLQGACADDDALRQRVEALLRSHEKAGGFMGKLPLAVATQTLLISSSMAVVTEKPGDRIGHYKLLQQIGEGGCGVVYVAEQEKPIRRRVALKVIKLGMDTKSVIARFEAERQALALMDHPNIAKVLDAGATETGRPFFVMELVRGIRITDYCDQNNLPTEDRLKLFMLVCSAIQHAHQKGIIHRDIKPSNILVTLHDGVPVPKVIDFGIAKATNDQRLTDKTVYTALDQFIGTPAYMSPEQAEMSGLDIDTRSDIYALGVLLYELLTGKTPFDAKRLVAAGLDGIRHIIREEEPPRPSTRLSTLAAEEQTTTANCRRTDAPRLINLVRGDLDWVVMKCIEKDRTRRYESASGLARDLERHSNNEPVLARSPSAVYRFQKLVRRNRLAVTAGAVVALVLLLGLVGTTWQALRATRAQQVTDQQRQHAESEARRADLSANAERTQRKKAEKAERRANEALSMSLVAEGERLVREDAAGKALAFFARAVRLDGSNRVAGMRIVSLLNQRSFPLPLAQRPESLGTPTNADNSASLSETNSDGNKDLILREKSVIDPKSGRELSKVVFGGEADSEPVFSANQDKMAILTSSNKVEVFFTRTGEPVLPSITARHIGGFRTLLFTPDGRELIVGGSGRGAIEVWDLVSKRPSFKKLREASTVMALDTSADGRRLVAGIRTGEAQLWDLRTGLRAGEPCPGRVNILEAALDPEGCFLTTRCQSRHGEGELKPQERFWDVRPGRAIPIALWHPGPVRRALYDSTGSWVGTLCGDGTVRVWRAEDGSLISEPALPGELVETMAFSPDATCVALGGTSGAVGVWDLRSNRLSWSKKLHSEAASQLVFSPHGEKLISGGGVRIDPSGGVGTVNIADARNGLVLAQITNKFGTVLSLALAQDGRRLAVAYRRYRAEIWDLESMQRLGESLTWDNGWVWHTVFSHDGRWLTSSGGDASQLWEAAAPVNQPLVVFPHGHHVVFTCFSADDNLLLTCSSDHTARVWERASGKPVTEPLPHESGVLMGAFASGDRDVLTASDPGGATVWEVRSGRALCDAFSHEGDSAPGVASAVFSPDSMHILTAGSDGTARIHAWVDLHESTPEWLPDLAEAVGGFYLNARGVAEYLDNAAQELAQLRQRLGTVPPTPLVKWALWYLADRSVRPMSPDSKLTVRDYASLLAKERGLPALEEALDLDPKNPMILGKLAALLESSRPETAELYRRLAKEFGGATPEVASRPAKDPNSLAGPVTTDSNATLDPRNGSAVLQRTGQVVTVRGTLVKMGTSRSQTYHYLNFSETSRTAVTLAFRISDNPSEFRPELLRGYLNKPVIVEGLVTEHLGVPQILMESLSQIKVVDRAADPASEKPTRLAKEVGGPGPELPSIETKASNRVAVTISMGDTKAPLDPRNGSAFLQRTGQVVTIRGTLVQMATSRSQTFHYLNFSKDYRTALTLAFLVSDNPTEFRPELLRDYVNKTVIVEGVVAEHLGVPQILMKSLSQIKVVDHAPASN